MKCMFVIAFCSFLSLFVFAHDDEDAVADLSDVSEGASILTFLLRIVLVGIDINKRLKDKVVQQFVFAAVCLSSLYTVDVLINALAAFGGRIGYPEWPSELLEITSMCFITIFRFYCLSVSQVQFNFVK